MFTTLAATPAEKYYLANISDTKPTKPYQEYPLFAHQNGRWAKKSKGKRRYFGVWADPDASLQKYLDEVDEIQAGRVSSLSRSSTIGCRSGQLMAYGV